MTDEEQYERLYTKLGSMERSLAVSMDREERIMETLEYLGE